VPSHWDEHTTSSRQFSVAEAAAAPGSSIVDRWTVLATARHGRFLFIRFPLDACTGGQPHVSVRETASQVSLRVVQAVTPLPTGVACADVAEVRTMKVRLPEPIDGRAIVGAIWNRSPRGGYGLETRTVPDPPLPDIILPLVPDVRGLRVKDAMRVLANNGLRARTNKHAGEVIGQSPKPGRFAPGTTTKTPFGGVVTLLANLRTPGLPHVLDRP
jgi:PASTA domain